jgi:hypothetical protein
MAHIRDLMYFHSSNFFPSSRTGCLDMESLFQIGELPLRRNGSFYRSGLCRKRHRHQEAEELLGSDFNLATHEIQGNPNA